ncbi:RNA-binding protein [Candidatus Synechococcus calcipolaris G9]|uniref:RNA-binding protein n=1 Tax=Candidatus Synechococcus calcipolaris G9 TaxID=1497997 RepID=A0ABT6EWB3_9SYNE|nr:R3H domain-containing nucleic acid-binding protein [Candidatus Synechococcus calcipolaris]MDG2990070.1 RNA-binding protein [Candidatus Synechococcus calcipolaris G9]
MTDEPIEQGRSWLEHTLGLAGFRASVAITPSPLEGVVDGCWLEIDQHSLSPQQITHLLDAKGQALDALQYLLNATVNLGRPREEQTAFTLELAGYRRDRYQQLQEIAEDVAHQVQETGEEVEIQGLSAAERRVVHTLIKTHGNVKTFSRGEEPDRRLVVHLQEEDEPLEEG